MNEAILIYQRLSVVVVPFPFTDRRQHKRRPALVISDAERFNARAGHSVLAMITSAEHQPWPLDVTLTDLGPTGLTAPSLVRMKLFTLDHRLVHRRVGALSEVDRDAVEAALRRLVAPTHSLGT